VIGSYHFRYEHWNKLLNIELQVTKYRIKEIV
jgi:hypothetical protein